jgi:PilZ domain
MIVFGKKCPSCGRKQLKARSSNASLFKCEDCQKQFLFLFLFSMSREHRLHVRKKLPPYFLVRIPGDTYHQYVSIKDISEGGICFSHSEVSFPGKFFMLDLYNCNDGSSLERLPVEIVATSPHDATIASNRARFVNLNHPQKKILSACIAQYGILN